jgi:hypothetical protein
LPEKKSGLRNRNTSTQNIVPSTLLSREISDRPASL